LIPNFAEIMKLCCWGNRSWVLGILRM